MNAAITWSPYACAASSAEPQFQTVRVPDSPPPPPFVSPPDGVVLAPLLRRRGVVLLGGR